MLVLFLLSIEIGIVIGRISISNPIETTIEDTNWIPDSSRAFFIISGKVVISEIDTIKIKGK